MDPDANLEEQLKLAQRLQNARDYGEDPDPDTVDRLSELVMALDAWIRLGGALPRKWAKSRGT